MDLERLDEIRGDSKLGDRLNNAVSGLSGDDHHWEEPLIKDLPRHLDPVHLGQSEVKKEEIRGERFCQRNGLFAVRGDADHGQSKLFELPPQELCEVRVILSDEDAKPGKFYPLRERRHVSDLGPWRSFERPKARFIS